MMKIPKHINVLFLQSIPLVIQSELKAISNRLNFTFLSPSETPQSIHNTVWEKTDVLITDVYLPHPNQVPNLKWINCLSPYNFESLLRFHAQLPEVILTAYSLCNIKLVAEKSLQQLLYLALNQNNSAEVIEGEYSATQKSPLTDSTIGIIGYDSLGRQLARDLHVYKATIFAATLNAMHPSSRSFEMPGTGDPEGGFFNRLYPIEAVGSMLALCDYVFLTLPKTPRVQRSASTKLLLQNLKQSAMLIDTQPGNRADIELLIKALKKNEIAGVGFQNLDPDKQEWLTKTLAGDMNLSLIHAAHENPKDYLPQMTEFFKANFENFLNNDVLYNQIFFDLLV